MEQNRLRTPRELVQRKVCEPRALWLNVASKPNPLCDVQRILWKMKRSSFPFQLSARITGPQFNRSESRPQRSMAKSASILGMNLGGLHMVFLCTVLRNYPNTRLPML